MSEKTKIAWCDSTVNFWEGCTKVSAGCANCYAAARDRRFTGGKLWGNGAPRRKSKSAVKDALAFNRKPWICDKCGMAYETAGIGLGKECLAVEGKRLAKAGETPCQCKNFHRRRIFSLSLGDWLDDEVNPEWIREMLETIFKCPDCTWILCSKRWENFKERLLSCVAGNWADPADFTDRIHAWVDGTRIPQHIIGLCSVESQEAADKRIPHFKRIPLACHGLSMEPLLGAIDLEPTRALWKPRAHTLSPENYIRWLIIGGESGANARPCNVDWIRSIVQQGKAAGVATFVKQLGGNPKMNEYPLPPLGDGFKLLDKKGGDPSEWPADLRIQEWPKGF